MKNGRNQYAPKQGVPQLREAIALKTKESRFCFAKKNETPERAAERLCKI